MKSLLLPLLLSTVLHAADRPNIVFIFADDWGRHASAYAVLDGSGTANDIISTPNFDRIAREGVLFRNAFVSSPSCTPCRSSLVSGKHFWQTGSASILHSKWNFSQPAFPLILKENGYHIGLTYKGWGPGQPANAPFGGADSLYQKAGSRFNVFSQTVTDLVKNGKPLGEAKEALYSEVRKNFDQFLSARPGKEPFFYLFGPTNTHRKWTKGSGKALWNLDPEDLKGKLPPFLPDVAEIRQDFADYLGEVQAVDAGIGVIYEQLQESGELENTVIIISGDHGAPGFPYGKVNLYDFGTRVPLAIRFGKNIKIGATIDRLTSLIDIAPTILDVAGVEIPAEMTGKSLLPVITGKEPGTSSDEAVFTGRERHVPSARDGNLPYPQRAIRTKDHLFIINFKPERWPAGDPRNLSPGKSPSENQLENHTRLTLADEDAGPTKSFMVRHRENDAWEKYYNRAYGKRPEYELYDLNADPDHMRNLSGKPGFGEIESDLKDRLMAELTRTNDPRVTGDRMFYETSPMTDGE